MEKAVPATIEGNQRSLRRVTACADPDRSPDIVKYCVRQPPSSFPPDLATAFIQAQSLDTSQTVYSESQSFMDRDSPEVVAERRSLGALPLIVLTRGKLDDDLPPDQAATQARMLMQLHDDVAKLSSVGSNRRIDGAGHYIQLDKPDAVLGAVSEVLAAARQRSRR
jgi:pimeloyl-ACP methyl ester carboxylesterase